MTLTALRLHILSATLLLTTGVIFTTKCYHMPATACIVGSALLAMWAGDRATVAWKNK